MKQLIAAFCMATYSIAAWTQTPKEEEPRKLIGVLDPSQRSRQQTEEAVDGYKGKIYGIYNRALKKEPSLRGAVVVVFTILPDGSVTNSRVSANDTGSTQFGADIVATVAGFRFPAAPKARPLTVSKRFEFYPLDSQAK